MLLLLALCANAPLRWSYALVPFPLSWFAARRRDPEAEIVVGHEPIDQEGTVVDSRWRRVELVTAHPRGRLGLDMLRYS